MQHNLIWLAVFLLIASPLGLLLAVLLDKEIRGSRFYQSALYLPVVLSLALVGFIWQLIYSPDQGLINNLFGSDVDWFGDQSINLWAVLVAASWRHVGYIMVLYLAGLKGVDMAQREAAKMDGATEVQTFRHVVFPALRPINVVVLVVTVIESLRAFDLVYIINRGRNGLELLSVLITNNIIGEASRIGFGSAIAVMLLVISLSFITVYLLQTFRKDACMTAVSTPAPPAPSQPVAPLKADKAPLRPARVLLHTCLVLVSLAWLLPMLWAAYTSLRPYDETAENGYVSIAKTLTLENYRNALEQGDLWLHFKNTMFIVVPALFFILLLSSMVAFVVSRFRFRGQIALLMLFTAGNLLPQQVIITPLYRIYRDVPLPSWMSDSETLFDSFWGIILIHVAFQIGFCTFVLSNYMKTLPEELTEAARVDGASAWRQYWQITLPLCRAPIAALATLEFTWVYNDFFWALVLMVSGDKRPITSALNNLQGQFFTDNNLVAAGSLLVALPTVLVYAVLQKQFIGGLTLGATKG